LTAVDDNEPFLSRWSRRKLKAKEHPPAALPAAELPAASPAALPAAATEPVAPESPQDVSSEYREFFDPRVDEMLRRTALKKLFSDPHFNVMDGLDTYIDDYSKPDPIPEAMLRRLNQAKELFLLDDEKKTAEGACNAASASAAGAAASPLEAANTTTQPNPQTGDASAQDIVAATGGAVAPPAKDIRHD
jgi:hypothetical protein